MENFDLTNYKECEVTTMADIKLFNINGKVKEYQSGNVTLEKELQTVIENNNALMLSIFFPVHL